MSRRPLQNRVRPDGTIVSSCHRGLLFGNRGGRIHDAESRQLHPTRRWASRQWICCTLEFKNRQRSVMGKSYTELFFLDEITAFSAGHRPCFECRRGDATNFAKAWNGSKIRTPAPTMDRVLHSQRLDGRGKRLFLTRWDDLPDGAMVRVDAHMIAKSESGPLLWSHAGYRPVWQTLARRLKGSIECLTPLSIVKALANGYQPLWHPTARIKHSAAHAPV